MSYKDMSYKERNGRGGLAEVVNETFGRQGDLDLDYNLGGHVRIRNQDECLAWAYDLTGELARFFGVEGWA